MGFGVEMVDMTSCKIFLRRVFPEQDETDPDVEKLVVSEMVKGEVVTHVDNCYVIVIQLEGTGINFDTFIVQKIREVTVIMEPREGNGPEYKITMDLGSSLPEVIGKLSMVLGSPSSSI